MIVIVPKVTLIVLINVYSACYIINYHGYQYLILYVFNKRSGHMHGDSCSSNLILRNNIGMRTSTGITVDIEYPYSTHTQIQGLRLSALK